MGIILIVDKTRCIDNYIFMCTGMYLYTVLLSIHNQWFIIVPIYQLKGKRSEKNRVITYMFKRV